MIRGYTDLWELMTVVDYTMLLAVERTKRAQV